MAGTIYYTTLIFEKRNEQKRFQNFREIKESIHNNSSGDEYE